MVEFALVVPLLLLVLTGIFSFGIIFNQYEVLTNATNSAARAFAVSAGSDGQQSQALNNDACAEVATIVQGSAPNITSSNLTYKIVYTHLPSSASPTVSTYNGTGGSAPTCSSLLLYSGDSVKVSVTYPVSATLFSWTSQNYTLSAQSTEFVQ
jgi:Flp pilus assembly protein TadG